MLLGCERLSSRLPNRARRLVRPGGDQSRRAKSWVASVSQASRSRFLGEARMQNATTKKLKHIIGQCKVLGIGGGRGGTSDVCSGDGRRGRYHTDGRMKRRHILVQVCVHLANLMQASLVGSACSSKRLSWNVEDFILGGGPPECYFGRWPPAYYSRTPLPTVKKEQEILRAKFANPERNGDNGIATAGNTFSLRGCFFTAWVGVVGLDFQCLW